MIAEETSRVGRTITKMHWRTKVCNSSAFFRENFGHRAKSVKLAEDPTAPQRIIALNEKQQIFMTFVDVENVSQVCFTSVF